MEFSITLQTIRISTCFLLSPPLGVNNPNPTPSYKIYGINGPIITKDCSPKQIGMYLTTTDKNFEYYETDVHGLSGTKSWNSENHLHILEAYPLIEFRDYFADLTWKDDDDNDKFFNIKVQPKCNGHPGAMYHLPGRIMNNKFDTGLNSPNLIKRIISTNDPNTGYDSETDSYIVNTDNTRIVVVDNTPYFFHKIDDIIDCLKQMCDLHNMKDDKTPSITPNEAEFDEWWRFSEEQLNSFKTV